MKAVYSYKNRCVKENFIKCATMGGSICIFNHNTEDFLDIQAFDVKAEGGKPVAYDDENCRTLVDALNRGTRLSTSTETFAMNKDDSSTTDVPVENYTKTELQEMKVTKIAYATRPLSSLDSRNLSASRDSRSAGSAIAPSFLHHAGVLTHTDDKKHLLIHRTGKPKNDKFSATVVEDWDKMDHSAWNVEKSEVLERNRSVYDFYKHGIPGKPYNPVTANCQHAAKRMFKKGK